MDCMYAVLTCIILRDTHVEWSSEFSTVNLPAKFMFGIKLVV